MLFHEFYMEQQFMLSVDGFYSVNKSSKFGRSRFQRTFPEIVFSQKVLVQKILALSQFFLTSFEIMPFGNETSVC